MTAGYMPSPLGGLIQYGVFTGDDSDAKKTPHKPFQFRMPGPLPPAIPFMHDMAITEHYTIFVDSSMEFAMPFGEGGTGPILKYNSARNFSFGVVPRFATSEKDIMWFHLDHPMVCNHIANAWEDPNDPDTIIFHAPVTYEAIDIFEHVGYWGKMTEFRLHLPTRTITKHQFDDASSISTEFPRVRDTLIGYPSRYAYTVRHGAQRTNISGLAKWDLYDRKLVAEIDFGPNESTVGLVGEPQFVPRRTPRADHHVDVGKAEKDEAEDEDDGYVLTTTMRPDHSTWLCIYDAKTFSSEPLACVRARERFPFGLHGAWRNLEDL
uniref:Carotenoid oxygenase n=1 Tax=Lotharella globosa TaxID=91324 RepID=A0A7S4DT04_9EUKA